MDKRGLSEADICMKLINPAIERAGWSLQTQVRREVTFTDGKVIVRGKLWKRGRRKRADYVLFRQKNLPLAVIEAKDNTHSVGAGMQQALAYAECLDVPFVFSSNGDGFLFHDRTGLSGETEATPGAGCRLPAVVCQFCGLLTWRVSLLRDSAFSRRELR